MSCASTWAGGVGKTGTSHPLPLHLDTSVIGGYDDAAFEDDTRKMWRLLGAGGVLG